MCEFLVVLVAGLEEQVRDLDEMPLRIDFQLHNPDIDDPVIKIVGNLIGHEMSVE